VLIVFKLRPDAIDNDQNQKAAEPRPEPGNPAV
jgi:SecD/SecF fusion protein